MKIKVLIVFFCIACSFSLFSQQKEIKDMSVAELGQKKTAALAANSTDEANVYEAALKIWQQIDAAVKAEEYEKAAALKEDLKKLKVVPPPPDKTKELQEQLKKAIDQEDYAKADQLKKQIEEIKNPKPAASASAPAQAISKTNTSKTNNSGKSAPSSASSASAPSASPPASSPSAPSSGGLNSALSKNDIYGGSVTYFGLDFSLFNYVSGKKLGEEQKHLKYISAWQKEFVGPTKRLGAWLGKSSFNEEKSMVEGAAIQNLNRQWIVATSRSISTDQIIPQLQSYKSNSHGLGFVIIPGSFDETINRMSVYYVWFDLDTRTIVHMQELSAKVGAGAMGRWLDGLVATTKTYVDDYYKKHL
jgi:hypothetical protein